VLQMGPPEVMWQQSNVYCSWC